MRSVGSVGSVMSTSVAAPSVMEPNGELDRGGSMVVDVEPSSQSTEENATRVEGAGEMAMYYDPDEAPDPLSLQALLRISADEADETKVEDRCTGPTKTRWSPRNDYVMRQVMLRIKHKKPWGWIRFADGDMNELGPIVVHNDDDDNSNSNSNISPSKRMMRAIGTWPTLDNLIVSVGSWWLCNDNFRNTWNQHMTPELLGNFTFHHQCFYLPMGTPDDDDMFMWQARGIRGWVRTALEADVPIVFVGSEQLRAIPWLSDAAYVNADSVATDTAKMDAALRARAIHLFIHISFLII